MKLVVLLLIAATALPSQEISHSTPPKVAFRVSPEYTKEALDAKLEGTVILSTVIDTGGRPTEIAVAKGLGLGLDQKAIECLRQWRFTPATRFAEPVPVNATIEIEFRLSNAKIQNPI